MKKISLTKDVSAVGMRVRACVAISRRLQRLRVSDPNVAGVVNELIKINHRQTLNTSFRWTSACVRAPACASELSQPACVSVVGRGTSRCQPTRRDASFGTSPPHLRRCCVLAEELFFKSC